MTESRLTPRQIALFVAVFAVLGFVALQVPMFQIIGAKAKFTLYDLFAPVASGFIGTIPGMIAVFFTQLFNFFAHGSQTLDIVAIVRFLTPLAAVLYFSKNRNLSLIIPVAAMVAFMVHPIGSTVWYYALFWLIPVAMYPLSTRFLPARALGATFTAHAIGGVAYLYAFNLPATVWNSLIPVVAMERIAFAAGITLTYLVLNNVLAYAEQRFPRLGALVEQRFVWRTR